MELDEVRTVEGESADGSVITIVIGRTGELRIVDEKTGISVMTGNVPYGSNLVVKKGQKVAKGSTLCSWDPYNAVIISEFAGVVGYQDIVQGLSYKVEID